MRSERIDTATGASRTGVDDHGPLYPDPRAFSPVVGSPVSTGKSSGPILASLLFLSVALMVSGCVTLELKFGRKSAEENTYEKSEKHDQSYIDQGPQFPGPVTR